MVANRSRKHRWAPPRKTNYKPKAEAINQNPKLQTPNKQTATTATPTPTRTPTATTATTAAAPAAAAPAAGPAKRETKRVIIVAPLGSST